MTTKKTGAKKKTNLAGFAPKPASVAVSSVPQPDAPKAKSFSIVRVPPDAPTTRSVPVLSSHPAPQPERTSPAERGPRGGRTANLADRAVAISFRVSKTQYRKICERRLDKNTTTQGLMELALGALFQKEWGEAF